MSEVCTCAIVEAVDMETPLLSVEGRLVLACRSGVHIASCSTFNYYVRTTKTIRTGGLFSLDFLLYRGVRLLPLILSQRGMACIQAVDCLRNQNEPATSLVISLPSVLDI